MNINPVAGIGDLQHNGVTLMRGGFMVGNPGVIHNTGTMNLTGETLQRGAGIDADVLGQLQRGEITDVSQLSQLIFAMQQEQNTLARTITTSQTAFPVRENLEAPAFKLVPEDTPLRNKLPRVPGSGLAAAWRQLTSLGGGWGSSFDQPGGGSATQMFYGESGAPASFTSVYASKSASYKLIGALGGVTGLAQAAGANYQDQYATETQNVLANTMLLEEHALINADSTSTSAPWGDGTNALAFDGLTTLVTTGNGVPSAQIKTSVGALTKAHLDLQIRQLVNQGARGIYMLINTQEATSLIRLAETSGSILRVNSNSNDLTLGVRVKSYAHSTAGDVPFIVSRFVPAGTIYFLSESGPGAQNVLEVDVLPQVPGITINGTQNIQGYVLTPLARTTSAPDIQPFLVSLYEVLKLKSATHVAKSTGVTAAS